jgi:hypothetical protein
VGERGGMSVGMGGVGECGVSRARASIAKLSGRGEGDGGLGGEGRFVPGARRGAEGLLKRRRDSHGHTDLRGQGRGGRVEECMVYWAGVQGGRGVEVG